MMKTFKLILLFFAIYFSACISNQDAPANIWPKEKMINILVDLELAQATIKFNSATHQSKEDFQPEFDKVFDKYKTNQEEFNDNLQYYCNTPVTTKEIYEEVIVVLSEQQGELNKERIKNKVPESDD